jgi:hypothetical protein
MDPIQNGQQQGSRLLDARVAEMDEDFVARVTQNLLNDGKFPGEARSLPLINLRGQLYRDS